MITSIHDSNQRIKVDDGTLGKRCDVSTEISEHTQRFTTQHGLRYFKENLDRRFKTRLTQLQRSLVFTKMYVDTMFANKKSVRRNTCVEILITSKDLASGMAFKRKAMHTLHLKKSTKKTGYQNC